MLLGDKIYLGTSTRAEYPAPKDADRHGPVTGATIAVGRERVFGSPLRSL